MENLPNPAGFFYVGLSPGATKSRPWGRQEDIDRYKGGEDLFLNPPANISAARDSGMTA